MQARSSSSSTGSSSSSSSSTSTMPALTGQLGYGVPSESPPKLVSKGHPKSQHGATGRARWDRDTKLTAVHSLREFHSSKDQALLNDLGTSINALN